MPIEPSWIRQGDPQARGVIVMQSADRKTSSGFWSCTSGEFIWQFAWDEFIYLLEGEVAVTEPDGKTYILKAGNIAHFPLGMQTTWHVIQPVKKFFVIRTTEALSL
ncbi:MAG: cupin domain-containing protein [Pirellulales bacterium]|nr:cupin domain-containing protein [Pirellulales bacterium]